MQKAALLLACTLPALSTPCPAFSQDRRSADTSPAPAATKDSARAGIESEGDAALDRMQHAIEGRRQGSSHIPILPREIPGDEKARQISRALQDRERDPAMKARARDAFEAGYEAMEREREVMAGRLGQALGLAAPDTATLAMGTIPAAAEGRVALLFVSSSMPVAILRTYAAQLERIGGVLAFRGMPGGLAKVEPMARLSAQILRIDPGCEGPACAMRNVQLIVDPLVFRAHGITRVPALAMIPGDPAQAYCERETGSPTSAHLIFGDAALSGLLEEYSRIGGRKDVRDAQARLDGR